MSFISYLINGISLGSVYALIALGYTMVYGIAKMLNFAHGDVIMVGAFITYTMCSTMGLSPVIGVLAAVVACTLLGMAIDAEKRRPILSTITGGMSGAAVKPIALRMVWQVAKAVKIPVIGLGGIMNWKDAVEFMLAGASAIQIGTANFIDPSVTIKVAEGINDYLERHKFSSVRDIIGALEV